MGTQSAPTQSLTYLASGAVRAYRAIGYDDAEATVAGQKVKGVAQRAAADGEASDAVTSGTTVVETGGVFALGDSLIVDTEGRAIAASGALGVGVGAVAMTSSAANGDVLTGADLPEYVFADALEASGAAGEQCEVHLRR